MGDERGDHALRRGPRAIRRADRARDVFEGGRATQQPPRAVEGEGELRIVPQARVEGCEIVVEAEHRTNERDDLSARTRARRTTRDGDDESLVAGAQRDPPRRAVPQAERRREREPARGDLVGWQPREAMRADGAAERNGLAARAQERQFEGRRGR